MLDEFIVNLLIGFLDYFYRGFELVSIMFFYFKYYFISDLNEL